MSGPHTRLHGADFLRASACLMVLLHHLAQRMDMRNVPDVARPVMGFLLTGSFGVSIFFVLSGYLLARPFWLALERNEAMPSLPIYAMRRAARILPAFWLALMLSFALGVILDGVPLDSQHLLRFSSGFFLVNDWHWLTLFPVDNNGPLWSIGFEVTAYILLPFCLAALFVLQLRGRAALLAWVSILTLVLLLHWLIVLWAPIDEVGRGWEHGLIGGAKAWMPRFNPIGFFAIFALGALAAGVQVRIADVRHWLFDVLGLLAVVAAVLVMLAHIGGPSEGYGLVGIPYGYPLMPLAIGVALLALPSSVWAGRLLDNRVARFVADISFGIYVWHFLVIGLIADHLPPAFQTWNEGGWNIWLWSSALAIVLSLGIATLSFYLLERPVVRWARSQERSRQQAVAPA
jgi:peptidoglycan/LPS O-acetylase OafA/YrhL